MTLWERIKFAFTEQPFITSEDWERYRTGRSMLVRLTKQVTISKVDALNMNFAHISKNPPKGRRKKEPALGAVGLGITKAFISHGGPVAVPREGYPDGTFTRGEEMPESLAEHIESQADVQTPDAESSTLEGGEMAGDA